MIEARADVLEDARGSPGGGRGVPGRTL